MNDKPILQKKKGKGKEGKRERGKEREGKEKHQII